MTAVMAAREAAPRADLRRASRVLGAVLLPIGPARRRHPSVRPALHDQPVAKRGRPGGGRPPRCRRTLVVWLGLLACLTLVPGVIYAGRVVGRTSPRLAAVATVLLVLGYISLSWLTVGDAYLLFGVRHHLPAATLVAMYNGVHPAASVAEGLFVAGHVLGTVLLGIAMLRGRVVPTWAAIATLVAQPIHFVAAVVVGSHALDLVGWGLNAVGFAALSLALLRLTDDQWAPAPAPAGPSSS